MKNTLEISLRIQKFTKLQNGVFSLSDLRNIKCTSGSVFLKKIKIFLLLYLV